MYPFIRVPFKILGYFSSLILLVSSALFFGVVLAPVYLYRLIISLIGPLISPQLVTILPARSVISAIDSIFTGPKINLIGTYHIEGNVNTEEFREEFSRKILHAKKSGKREGLARPELQQRLTTFGGFFFWAKINKFDLADHIKDFPEEKIVDRNRLVEISLQLLKKPYLKNKPIWEIYIIRNFIEKDGVKNTVVLIRMHHALADGFSIFKLTTDFLGNIAASEDLKKFEQKHPNSGSLLQKFMGLLNLVPELISALDFNEWRLPEWRLSKETCAALSAQLPMSTFKGIAKGHQVSLTSVILAGISGGVRRFMESRGVRVPPKIHAGMPMSMPGHPETKLRNHLTMSIIQLPVGIEERTARLREMDAILKRARRSALPHFMFCLIKLIGGLLPFMIRPFIRNVLTTALLSSMPGPSQLLKFKGQRVYELSFGSTLLPGCTAIGFTTLSYCGGINFVAGGNSKIIPTNEDAQELVRFIMEEFKALQMENIV